jgi:hypothetical protein|uniref:Uncharacterized protein n=1 Tax=Picea sitchensis TaxID=3332 RepID=A0A6B9XYU9_PICSI|nr:hypothetical protein Q903MT_gene5843 [Picea sitchensis]
MALALSLDLEPSLTACHRPSIIGAFPLPYQPIHSTRNRSLVWHAIFTLTTLASVFTYYLHTFRAKHVSLRPLR